MKAEEFVEGVYYTALKGFRALDAKNNAVPIPKDARLAYLYLGKTVGRLRHFAFLHNGKRVDVAPLVIQNLKAL